MSRSPEPPDPVFSPAQQEWIRQLIQANQPPPPPPPAIENTASQLQSASLSSATTTTTATSGIPGNLGKWQENHWQSRALVRPSPVTVSANPIT